MAARDQKKALDDLQTAIDNLHSRVEAYLTAKIPDLVLVVEDNTSTASLVTVALRAHGMRVKRAATIGEARDIIKNEAVGVAVVDMQLPDGDGWNFAEKLPHSIAVALMSAVVSENDMPAIKRRAGAQVVVSPVNLSNFTETISRLVKR